MERTKQIYLEDKKWLPHLSLGIGQLENCERKDIFWGENDESSEANLGCEVSGMILEDTEQPPRWDWESRETLRGRKVEKGREKKE